MKVTIKTMDAGSRDFELSDDATVEALKKQIADKMEIPLDKQRLIFHGKVLKDDKPLKEYGVDGMVVHLVKSAPPPAEPGQPINQPQRRVVSTSVRQDDDHTITLEATQDMLFMSPEGLPSEGDIAQMTQNIVSQIVGALSSHGASGTVSAEATATDTEGKTHILSATASTKKPDEIKTDDTTADEPPKAMEGVTEAGKASTPAGAGEKTTPTATPSTQPGPSSVAAATGQEEEVKPKPAEKKTEAPRRPLIEFDDNDDPEELERLEQERIQRSMKNLYSHARTVRRCIQYATKVLDRYDKSQERVAKKKADDEAKAVAGIPLDQEVMVDLREALLADRRKAKEEEQKANEKMEVSEDDPFAILHSGNLDFIPSQLYFKFKDELDHVEARAQPIINDFRRLVDENASLDDDELVQAQRVAITVKDFNYYIGHAYVALGRLDVQLDRPAPRHLRLYAPRRTEMRRIFQQLRSMPPAPPSGYIIDIQREGEGGSGSGGGGAAGGGASGPGRTTRAMISRGPASLFSRFAGMDPNTPLSVALGRERESRSGGLEELSNRTSGPDFKAKLDEIRKEQAEKQQKEGEEANKEEGGEAASEDKKEGGESSGAAAAAPTDAAPVQTEPSSGKQELETKAEDEAMDTSEQTFEQAPQTEEKPMEQNKPSSGGGGGDSGGVASGSGEGGASGEGGEGEKKETGEKKEGEEGEGGEEDGETPQYLARLLSELITGMVAPGMEAAPNDAIHEVEKQGGVAADATGGGASAKEGATGESSSSAGEGSKSAAEGGEGEGEGGASGSASGGDADGAEGSGGTDDEKKEPKKMSFAERYAGPEGTTVTIKAAPQMPTFPGLPPMEGPSVSIRNPGGGKPPEAVVNFPMPPAFQLLRMMLRRAQQREKEEQEAAAKGEGAAGAGGEGGEGSGEGGASGEGEPAEKKPKKPRLVLPPRQKEKPFIDEDGDLSSVSDAGSLDSIDSDDDGPKDEEILFGDPSLKGIGGHRSMHDAMAELRDHFGDSYDEEEEEELGMVEMLLKAISRQISVIEVMSVFQGNTDPLKKLQTPLKNFIEDKILYGAPPTPERKEMAVVNFLMNCERSVREVEDRIPLRDRGIDFPKTIYKILREIFEEGYEYITSRYTTRTPLSFARSLKYWATRSSARFGGVVRHCLDGNGEEFEETVKMLMSTLFPPTTPPLILSMCSSSILKEIRRLKDNYHFTPMAMEKYLIWKEGAKPTPNKSYPLNQFMQNYVLYHDNTPLPVMQKESVEGGGAEGGAKKEGEGTSGGPSSSAEGGPQQPFSDAFLSDMPAKKRKLDTSELQTIESPALLDQLIKKAFDVTGAKPTEESDKTLEGHMEELKNDKTLVGSLVEEFYYTIRDRLEKDPNYDPELYPHAHEFFKVRKWVKKEEEEKRKEAEKQQKKEAAEGGASTSATPTASSSSTGENN